MPGSTENPYLTGNYAPVVDETTIQELRVDGTIPCALLGRYVRTGPNPIGTPARPYVWADGDGMVHEIALRGPRSASYRNRWVATDRASTVLGTEPLPGGAERDDGDIANTNAIAMGRRTLCFGRRSGYELGLDLATVRRCVLGLGDHAFARRPRIDQHTGGLHLVSSAAPPPTVVHLVVTPFGEIVHVRRAASAGAHHVNDFVLTERWIVLFADDAVGLLHRDGGSVDWIPHRLAAGIDPIAAEDRTGRVIALVSDPGLTAWTIDPRRRTLRREPLDASPCAFAQVAEHRPSGRLPRYAYSIGRGDSMPFDGTEVVKHDLVTLTRTRKDFGAGRHPGEFLFVDDPDRPAEDGGWLVGLVHDDHTGLAELVVLDAGDVGAPAVATVHTTRRVPYGLHGSWTPFRASSSHPVVSVTEPLQRDDSAPPDPPSRRTTPHQERS